MVSVLIIDDHQYESKIENHLMPLANVASNNKMICVNKNENVSNINYLTVPTFGIRLIGILLILPFGIIEAYRNDYDLVIAVSVIPYGLFSLIIGFFYRIPVHLVIIGGDLDNHAVSWYGSLIKLLLLFFDTISVLGTKHKERLADIGISKDDIFILANSVDIGEFQPAPIAKKYDFIWVGKFLRVKNPTLFVQALSKYREQKSDDFKAVMVGDGPLKQQVESTVQKYGLSESVDFPGWVNNPAKYYQRSKIYIMTSEREAMGLTLIEALCTGLPVVVPDIGNISDVVEDGENGFLHESINETKIVNSLSILIDNKSIYRKMSKTALKTREDYSYKNAQTDWENIIYKTTQEERCSDRDEG